MYWSLGVVIVTRFEPMPMLAYVIPINLLPDSAVTRATQFGKYSWHNKENTESRCEYAGFFFF
jgi:hypothetical protein